MNREIRILRMAGELCSRLGLPLPEIRTQGGILSTERYKHTRNLGYCVWGRLPYIEINTSKHRSPSALRETIAHELTHYAFPQLKHGPDFEKRIKGLLSGNLFFRGSMRSIGWTPDYSRRVMLKVDVFDDSMPPKPRSTTEKAQELRSKIKRFDTKIKRLTTLRKKAERKLKRITT